MKKKGNRQQLLVALLIAAILLFSGCKKKEEPQPPPQPPPKPKPAATVVPVQKRVSSVKAADGGAPQFDFSGKKDPFKPYVVVPVPQEQLRKPGASARRLDLLPIQSYDVNKFKVAGIIAGLNENTALVIDPTGKGYVVKQGMLIGNSDGRITRITSSMIEVTEKYPDENGHMKKRTVNLTLPQKK